MIQWFIPAHWEPCCVLQHFLLSILILLQAQHTDLAPLTDFLLFLSSCKSSGKALCIFFRSFTTVNRESRTPKDCICTNKDISPFKGALTNYIYLADQKSWLLRLNFFSLFLSEPVLPWWRGVLQQRSLRILLNILSVLLLMAQCTKTNPYVWRARSWVRGRRDKPVPAPALLSHQNTEHVVCGRGKTEFVLH